jgi:hypothetical protein
MFFYKGLSSLRTLPLHWEINPQRFCIAEKIGANHGTDTGKGEFALLYETIGLKICYCRPIAINWWNVYNIYV